MEQSCQSPGTVSRILWHFTGGPTWNAAKEKQGTSPKPAAQAYKNLQGILKSRELRLGGYKEVVRIKRTVRKFNKASRSYEVRTNVASKLVSAPVCCLADVPIVHLSYLALRYGKFAIGFHRDTVVRHGFNPVFYTLEDAAAINSIYRGFSQLKNVDSEVVRLGLEFAREAIEAFVKSQHLSESPGATPVWWTG